MKKIRLTKTAQLSQFYPMAERLRHKLNSSYVSIACTVASSASSDYLTDINYLFQVAIQPGLDGTICSLHWANSWAELLDFYNKKMMEE